MNQSGTAHIVIGRGVEVVGGEGKVWKVGRIRHLTLNDELPPLVPRCCIRERPAVAAAVRQWSAVMIAHGTSHCRHDKEPPCPYDENDRGTPSRGIPPVPSGWVSAMMRLCHFEEDSHQTVE